MGSQKKKNYKPNKTYLLFFFFFKLGNDVIYFIEISHNIPNLNSIEGGIVNT